MVCGARREEVTGIEAQGSGFKIDTTETPAGYHGLDVFKLLTDEDHGYRLEIE